MSHRRTTRWLLPLTLLAISPLAHAALEPPVEKSDERTDQFLRVVQQPDGRAVRLEVAARTYESTEPGRPKVVLVSVAHIADKPLYTALQRLMDAQDLVLYESVKPAGAGRPGGDTPDERRASTEASMRFVASLLELHRQKRDAYPKSLDELAVFTKSVDERLAQWLVSAATDAWERSLIYTLEGDAAAPSFTLLSRGADGEPGGGEEAADLEIRGADGIQPVSLSSEGGIQAELANALGLAFQLEAINYGGEHWRASDMTMDAVNRALQARGVRGFALGDALAGTSLSGRVATFLLRLIRFADRLADGVIADNVKLMLIEMLGNEEMVNRSLDQQFGRGFAEVIVDLRNQVVIDDLIHIVEHEPAVESVAIFYGAAHMRDMAQRLDDQLGYTPRAVEWFPAITLDLSRSALSERDVQQMRRMLRRQFDQMR